MFKGSLKKMLGERQLLSPCVWDCYSMKAVQMAGFDCALLSGSSVSESLTGIPDLGLISVDELVGVAERVAHFADIPLLVDFDEGYGDSPLNVARNVEKLLKAGVAGFTLDDGMGIRGYDRLAQSRNIDMVKKGVKVDPYRVVPVETYIAKIKAALDVVQGTDCVLIARTEARPIHGLDDAIDRCRRAQDIGAPMTLVNRYYNIEECRHAADILNGWKMYPDVVIQPDRKPEVELEDIEKLGFNFVTMHYLEKGSMYGMLDFGLKNYANRSTVYSETHDMGGLDRAMYRKAMSFGADSLLKREAEYYKFAEEVCKK
ncbi:MAG: isocitrate lyase/PEP mutase family protein [Christensenellales bacterium]|nr:isocitrate lyase/PEP mutase family protein [Christensenellales bacterium]